MGPETPEEQAGEGSRHGRREDRERHWPFVREVTEQSITGHGCSWARQVGYHTDNECVIDIPFMMAINPVPPGRVMFMSFAKAIDSVTKQSMTQFSRHGTHLGSTEKG